MGFWNTVRIALRSLAKNRMRAALTTLGVVIGIAAVTAMVSIGQSPPRYFLSAAAELATPSLASFVVNGTSQDLMRPLLPKIEEFCLEHFPDVRATVDWLPLGPPAAAPVQIILSGKEEERLFEIVDEVKAKLATFETKNIRDNWGQRTKKLRVVQRLPESLL